MLVQKIYSAPIGINLVNKTNDLSTKQNCANVSQCNGNARIPAFALYFTSVHPQGVLETIYRQRAQVFTDIMNYLSGATRSAVKTEEFVDKLGQIKLFALNKNDAESIKSVNAISKKLFPNSKNISVETYIRSLKSRLEKAIATNQNIVFVKGHKNPDVDSVVSSILEAHRNTCLDPKNSYIPVVDGNYLGDDVRCLLSKAEQNSLIYTESDMYKQASANPSTKWIFVDHNKELHLQNRVIKIIDHHHLADEANNPDIPINAEKIGSTAALVAIKIMGSGIEMGQSAARLLYGGALRDTENYKPRKMTEKDSFVMKILKEKAKLAESFYGDMMRAFIKTPKTAEQLFHQDYKQDGFGYAVCETSEFFKHGHPSLENVKVLNELISIAQKNNTDKNLPFTLVHFQDFPHHCEHIDNQRMYVVFNDNLASGKQKEIFGKVSEIVGELAHNDANISINTQENFIEVGNSSGKISRKKVSPYLRAALE